MEGDLEFVLKQNELLLVFKECLTEEDKYKKIIQLGKEMPMFSEQDKIAENIVEGCQSTMYLKSRMEDGRIYFTVYSEALISAGLAALLVFVYSGQKFETVLKSHPSFLHELGLENNLSANRVNGLYSIHMRMKQEALKAIMGKL